MNQWHGWYQVLFVSCSWLSRSDYKYSFLCIYFSLLLSIISHLLSCQIFFSVFRWNRIHFYSIIGFIIVSHGCVFHYRIWTLFRWIIEYWKITNLQSAWMSRNDFYSDARASNLKLFVFTIGLGVGSSMKFPCSF